MHATNNDPAFSLHDCRQRLGASRRARSRFAGGNENWVVRLDGGGIDDELGWSGKRIVASFIRTVSSDAAAENPRLRRVVGRGLNVGGTELRIDQPLPAPTKPANNGWADVGFDLNSGWYCTATNQG